MEDFAVGCNLFPKLSMRAACRHWLSHLTLRSPASVSKTFLWGVLRCGGVQLISETLHESRLHTLAVAPNTKKPRLCIEDFFMGSIIIERKLNRTYYNIPLDL